jgi:hypothetical protein
MFDLKPVGGSMVILTDVYKIDTGNAALGMDVNQILQSSWSLSESCSTRASSLGIHETDKWQFCRRHHPPVALALSIAFSALGA